MWAVVGYLFALIGAACGIFMLFLFIRIFADTDKSAIQIAVAAVVIIGLVSLFSSGKGGGNYLEPVYKSNGYRR